MKFPLFLLILVSILLFTVSCTNSQKETAQNNATKEVTNSFKEIEKIYLSNIEKCINNLEATKKALNFIDKDIEYNKIHIQKSQEHYREARAYFKKIEPILSFVDVENYKTLNAPNLLKVEEEDATNIKINEPFGFQPLEELLFLEIDSIGNIEEEVIQTIQKNADKTLQRLRLIQRNTNLSVYKNYHFLWLFRDAIFRVALTGITGFDSPSGISLDDNKIVYQELENYLSFFEAEFQNKEIYQEWKESLQKSQRFLTQDDKTNFENFDRYSFIKNYTENQIEIWNKTVKDWKIEFPLELAIQNDATSLFSDSTFNLNFFSDQQLGQISKDKIVLGKQLFNDVNLSSNKKMSCATCHQQDLAFTDGKKFPKGQKRNSPTLMYAALQKSFFHDNRAGSLEGQIISVINNKTEFHTSAEILLEAVKENSVYVQKFSELYSDSLTEQNIRTAMADYIRSLAPFSSKFDKNIKGIENTFTKNEINGFNLFMGKAACATCHFAPVFNGTIAPSFRESEMELIAVPSKNDTINAKIDEDLGRYDVFQTEEKKYFFKTPTLRNISKTAPYMHNGVYETLEEVMDFYNRGGGKGIGIDLKYQTLPFESLNLSKQEINDIIAFLESLEDE
ncbi:cytochrome c peroxidase [Bernardetia litoralis DSM 6794]|uniref:Cytochrome c peroxidase n=1 Tax=Bernardetia litoralis (strain ATCC 23117 / DSM 6794 / NBRC 15988 / NCIMB 1366 / Fx l1 / Sio-4) TaxID=880071 RepID=I4AI01_BERLS|nr:cytochrome c peroxidase [Bernardetia litoralis]AFM03586.1 cytochrome c peroxidase [Bernardetia litoralis DSM 6794]